MLDTISLAESVEALVWCYWVCKPFKTDADNSTSSIAINKVWGSKINTLSAELRQLIIPSFSRAPILLLDARTKDFDVIFGRLLSPDDAL